MDEVRGESPDERTAAAAAEDRRGFKESRNFDEEDSTTRIQARLERGVGCGPDPQSGPVRYPTEPSSGFQSRLAPAGRENEPLGRWRIRQFCAQQTTRN